MESRAVTPAELELLLGWHEWASERLLAAARAVKAERFATGGPGSVPSPRDALVRLANHDATWLARWRGAPVSSAFFPGAVRDPNALAGRWGIVREEMRAVLLARAPDGLDEAWRYRTRSGRPIRTTWSLSALHALTRAGHLRATAALALRDAGARGVHVDLAAFLETRPAGDA